MATILYLDGLRIPLGDFLSRNGANVIAEAEELARPGRMFRVWSYTPSHRALILRSNGFNRDSEATRIEIYFGHVEFMCLKPFYRGIRLRRASAANAEFLDPILPAGYDIDGVYLIDDGTSFVYSGAPEWREAECEPDEPSFFNFAYEWTEDRVILRGQLMN